MKDYRMEIVRWLDEIMITRFLLTREEDWLYVELDYACVHGRTSKQGRVCTTIYIRSLGPCRNIDTANVSDPSINKMSTL